jgi:hypothetical protein
MLSPGWRVQVRLQGKGRQSSALDRTELGEEQLKMAVGFSGYSAPEATLWLCAIESHVSPCCGRYQLPLWQKGAEVSGWTMGEFGMVVLRLPWLQREVAYLGCDWMNSS